MLYILCHQRILIQYEHSSIQTVACVGKAGRSEMADLFSVVSPCRMFLSSSAREASRPLSRFAGGSGPGPASGAVIARLSRMPDRVAASTVP